MHIGSTRIAGKTLRIPAVVAASLALALGPSIAQSIPVQLGPTPPQDVMPMADKGLEIALAMLPSYVAETMERSMVPGVAVAVVHGGETVFSQGFGVRKLGDPAPVDPTTVFQVASVSKSISATIAAIQVTKGVVSWNDPVSSRLPGFALSDPYVTAHATIGDFFAHRTGLPFAAGDELEDLGFSRSDILARLSQLPLDSFRTSYHYANFSTTTGAEAVAAASGEVWEDLAQDVLYKPLGMTSTSSRHADYLARPNRAVLHALVDGRFQPLYDRDPDAQAPAGGVSSNVVDLAEWLKLLLGVGHAPRQPDIAAKDLQPAITAQSFSAPAHAADARSGFYGYGFNVGVNPNGRTGMGHSGAFLLGAGTYFQILPSADIGIVVLTNGSPVGAAESIAAQFMDTVQYGAPIRDWYPLYNGLMKGYYNPEGDLAGRQPPSDPQPAEPIASYAGQYGNTYYGTAQVTVDGDRLTLTLGPAGKRFPLQMWSGDEFAIPLSGENAPAGSLSSVRFAMQDGIATGFTIDYFDANGLGTWRK
ncbi:serine hydrolase [Mesorhizobium sp. LHD-90]|uniref:serine hydrolase n=1 Tax=Mesorhizobium sp. LHD-90 TaxID=3071414 RepID=UPI0027E1AC98|nr:serine hydrolase [Mesorhizobium sp. LHD-90]MDQ6434801.1 serine hydrolase [Mesorhizobium sp. LHD-90]